MEFRVEPGYEDVADVLQQSLDQSQVGKGKARHATGEPFRDQKIMQGARASGLGGMSYQVYKKALEAQRQAEEGNYDGAYSNLKGAIVYAAAQFLRTKEMEREEELSEKDDEGKGRQNPLCPVCDDGEKLFCKESLLGGLTIMPCPACDRISKHTWPQEKSHG